MGIILRLSLLIPVLLLLHPYPLQAEDRLVTSTFQLAKQGDGEAQFSLGLMYDTGDRLERDPKQAVYWFTKAAASGITGAWLYLGMKYNFGSGVAPDKEKAIYWYEKAAGKGWPKAAYLLGNLYLTSRPLDQTRGCTWLNIAAKQDYPGAKQAVQQKCSDQRSVLPSNGR